MYVYMYRQTQGKRQRHTCTGRQTGGQTNRRTNLLYDKLSCLASKGQCLEQGDEVLQCRGCTAGAVAPQHRSSWSRESKGWALPFWHGGDGSGWFVGNSSCAATSRERTGTKLLHVIADQLPTRGKHTLKEKGWGHECERRVKHSIHQATCMYVHVCNTMYCK